MLFKKMIICDIYNEQKYINECCKQITKYLQVFVKMRLAFRSNTKYSSKRHVDCAQLFIISADLVYFTADFVNYRS